jgi:hypothetical protein
MLVLLYRGFKSKPHKELVMNKRNVIFSGLLILLGCAFLLLTGCPSGLTDDAGGQSIARTAINPAALNDPPEVFVKTITLPYGTPSIYTVYYDLATGDVVDPATEPWDFSVECQETGVPLKNSGLVFFHTNSGDSGPGDGAVWFTEKTNFASTQFSDRVTDFSGDYAEYAPYVTDVTRYAFGMDSSKYETSMNMTTYFGFYGGTGTDEDPFQVVPYTPPLSDYIFYLFNKKAAWTDRGNMPPNLGPTGRVYIIQHSDGVTYSKLQVSSFSLNPTSLVYSITLQFTEVSPPTPQRGGALSE